jgi:L-ascorbate metabolism protein UlaG (beta-lactamase superfamily)
MAKLIFTLFLTCFIGASVLLAQIQFQTDTIKTSTGDIGITFIGHGTLMFQYNNLVIHVDPVGQYANYAKLPKADIILVTHHHGDHLDKTAIATIKKPSTDIILTATCAREIKSGTILKNGDTKVVQGIKVEAVPAYNLVNKRDTGEPYHPRGEGNGYVFTLGKVKIYVAGDTENVPEMRKLTGIDIAFLPMNLPYTMAPEMVAKAVRMFNPKILYPYHFGNTNVQELLELLKDKQDLKIMIRKLN